MNFIYEIVYTDKHGVLAKRHGNVCFVGATTTANDNELYDLIGSLMRDGAKDLRLNILGA
jgi:hypothetical protein